MISEKRTLSDYADIIDFEYHGTTTHTPMPMEKRASIFSPFAALSGMGEMFEEETRYTDEAIELTEDQMEEIDRHLRHLEAELAQKRKAEALITYFIPDIRKDGGMYHTETMSLKKIDRISQNIVTTGGTTIPVQNILKITIPGEE